MALRTSPVWPCTLNRNAGSNNIKGRADMDSTNYLQLGEGSEIEFENVPLYFEKGEFTEVFSRKNNKTVHETLFHHRYTKLGAETTNRYPDYLGWPVGKFLGQLKKAGDDFYLRYLNKYGDLTYCRFSIIETRFLKKKGIYAFTQDGKIRYIGRCKDNFNKRINNGYGRVDPKNCYLDGQATNCHLNALIARYRSSVSLWIRILANDDMIEGLETRLIELYNPPWNILLKKT